MSKQIFTSDELVVAVRDALSCGNTNATGTDDARILKHLNTAMLTRVVPEIMKTREEYFVTAVEMTLVGSQSRYRIPERAFLQKLRTLFLLSSSSDLRSLREVQPEDRWRYGSESSGGDPVGYFIEGLDVVLMPAVGAVAPGSLEVAFYFRPNDLVLTAEARQITTVNLTTRQVVIAVDPTSWTTANRFDIHSQLSGGQMKAFDLVASLIQPGVPDINHDTYTFSTEIDGSVRGRRAVEVGDWLCLAGEAVVPMIPKEMHGILIDAAALRILKSLGDQPNLQSQAGLLAQDLDGLTVVTERRNEGKPLRIRGRRGLLWGGRH